MYSTIKVQKALNKISSSYLTKKQQADLESETEFKVERISSKEKSDALFRSKQCSSCMHEPGKGIEFGDGFYKNGDKSI